MTPRSLGWHLSRCGWTSPPLTHWELITVQWTNSVYRLPTHAQVASRWIRLSTVVKRSSVVGPAVYCTSRQREIQCSIPRNFFESRVSRVSLTSLVQMLICVMVCLVCVFQMAVGKGVQIMSVEWVEKCWELRDDSLTNATDEHLVMCTNCSSAFTTSIFCTLIHGNSYGHVWMYSVSQKKSPPLKFSDIFPKQLGIFSPNFTCRLYVPVYAGLQTFIQLPATLMKLCHIKRDHHHMLKMSAIGRNARWVVALNIA